MRRGAEKRGEGREEVEGRRKRGISLYPLNSRNEGFWQQRHCLTVERMIQILIYCPPLLLFRIVHTLLVIKYLNKDIMSNDGYIITPLKNIVIQFKFPLESWEEA